MSNIADVMGILKEAMQNDPNYAHGWHCNIAMSCYDEIMDSTLDTFKHEDVMKAVNNAASRFMKLCFDAETKG